MPSSIPHTVRLRVCVINPVTSAQNVRNVGAVKPQRQTASKSDNDGGIVPSGSRCFFLSVTSRAENGPHHSTERLIALQFTFPVIQKVRNTREPVELVKSSLLVRVVFVGLLA
jgi:hypothetical protein